MILERPSNTDLKWFWNDPPPCHPVDMFRVGRFKNWLKLGTQAVLTQLTLLQVLNKINTISRWITMKKTNISHTSWFLYWVMLNSTDKCSLHFMHEYTRIPSSFFVTIKERFCDRILFPMTSILDKSPITTCRIMSTVFHKLCLTKVKSNIRILYSMKINDVHI